MQQSTQCHCPPEVQLICAATSVHSFRKGHWRETTLRSIVHCIILLSCRILVLRKPLLSKALQLRAHPLWLWAVSDQAGWHQCSLYTTLASVYKDLSSPACATRNISCKLICSWFRSSRPVKCSACLWVTPPLAAMGPVCEKLCLIRCECNPLQLIKRQRCVPFSGCAVHA